jgi:phosphate-selective porin
MPRSLSTDLQTQVSSTATKTAFLVELNLSSTIRLTDWYSNVTYDSNSYEAGGSFLEVNSTTETGQLEVNEINIGFSNITDQVRSLVQDGAFSDKTVEIYIAYFNSDETIVGAINYFTGQIRNVSIQEDIESSVLNMTVASHWANWNLTKGRHYSDESQQTFSTGDKGMEFATQVKENVRWGM